MTHHDAFPNRGVLHARTYRRTQMAASIAGPSRCVMCVMPGAPMSQVASRARDHLDAAGRASASTARDIGSSSKPRPERAMVCGIPTAGHFQNGSSEPCTLLPCGETPAPLPRRNRVGRSRASYPRIEHFPCPSRVGARVSHTQPTMRRNELRSEIPTGQRQTRRLKSREPNWLLARELVP
jgi:hypothetical protein